MGGGPRNNQPGKDERCRVKLGDREKGEEEGERGANGKWLLSACLEDSGSRNCHQSLNTALYPAIRGSLILVVPKLVILHETNHQKQQQRSSSSIPQNEARPPIPRPYVWHGTKRRSLPQQTK